MAVLFQSRCLPQGTGPDKLNLTEEKHVPKPEESRETILSQPGVDVREHFVDGLVIQPVLHGGRQEPIASGVTRQVVGIGVSMTGGRIQRDTEV